jgi:hypothetical protein
MRFASLIWNGRRGLAVDAGGAKFVGRYSEDPHYPGDLHNAGLVAGYNQLLSGDAIDMSSVLRLPPVLPLSMDALVSRRSREPLARARLGGSILRRACGCQVLLHHLKDGRKRFVARMHQME